MTFQSIVYHITFASNRVDYSFSYLRGLYFSQRFYFPSHQLCWSQPSTIVLLNKCQLFPLLPSVRQGPKQCQISQPPEQSMKQFLNPNLVKLIVQQIKCHSVVRNHKSYKTTQVHPQTQLKKKISDLNNLPDIPYCNWALGL